MYDLIVIGGGPAGLAAARAAWNEGLRRILLIERDDFVGGILNQCIHNGFGLHRFKEELTGPEYAERDIKLLRETGVEVRAGAMALQVTEDKEVRIVSKTEGYTVEKAKSVILAMGCRERTRGAIGTPGTRPSGVVTAGAAQLYTNISGYMPGRRVVILGSGDIGLIMARRMTLEGAKVLACVEIMKNSGGLTRNIVQCLQDYGIPLYLSHTVTEVKGKNRVELVVVAKVDENLKPVSGSEFTIDCDTLMLSVGLIPENELTRGAGIETDPATGGAKIGENTETSVPGIFACGNVAHVHDLVDFVTAEAEIAGAAAAAYASGKVVSENNHSCCAENAAESRRFLLDSRIVFNRNDPENYGGGKRPLIQVERKGVPPEDAIVCVVCPKGCYLKVSEDGSVTGNGCARGVAYGKKERTAPERAVTSTVRVEGGRLTRCPVKTTRPIPKNLLTEAVKALDNVTLTAPVKPGQVAFRDVLGTGADFVTTRAIDVMANVELPDKLKTRRDRVERLYTGSGSGYDKFPCGSV